MSGERKRLLEVLRAFPSVPVVALVDLVADEFLFCRTSRISREAPAALILRFEEREMRLGGGANAVANLRALGAEVRPVGVVGDDPPGHELLARLEGLGIEAGGIRVDPGYRTVVKSRVLTSYHHSTRQQVLRIDREDQVGDGDVRDWLGRRAGERLDGARALLVSDYGYGAAVPGLAAPVVAEAHRRRLAVTLDSRYRLLDHRRVTAATPNEPEVEAALGRTIGDDLDALEAAGREVLRRLEAEAVVITRGSKGMALFERASGPTLHVPVWGSDQIADVTGAGDTVIAVFTLALAAGASHREAALLSNYAGGIVVTKMGTATVTPAELEAAVGSDGP